MQRNQHVIKLLSDLVAIDSQSHKGNEAIIAYLAQLFPSYKQTMQSWVRESDGVKGKNLVIKIPGKKSDHAIVFVGHVDTVPTSSAWETDPFILEESGGNLYGLGGCDTKGGVAALIEAVVTLTDAPAYDTYVIFDGDEEVYSTGAHKLLKNFSIKNPHFIFVEPTDGELHIAQRGLLKFNVITHGTATHASLGTPEKNKKENAISKMGEVLQILSKDAADIAKEKHEYLTASTQNFGVLTGGTARNVSADTATLTVDRRLIPNRIPQKEFQRISQLVSQYVPGTTVVLDDEGPGFSMDKNNLFIRQLLQAYTAVVPTARIAAFQAWSEAGLFAGKGDIVILGPGSLIHEAHRANEFVQAQEVFHFVHIYQKIIQEIQF